MTDATDRLIATTRRRLFAVTLGLVALLVVGVGVTTALAGLRALDTDVDHALEATATMALARLDGELPATHVPHESEEMAPAASDTFLLYLDGSGRLVADPSLVGLPGLPDAEAVAAAAAAGRDLRTVNAGGVPVRLLTLPIPHAGEGGGATGPAIGYIQAGFVLTLHDRQSASLVLAVTLVGLVGLLGAALVTRIVTGRALVPIRRTLDAQRRFVADASHELRTPAALIRSTAEVVARENLVLPEGLSLVQDIVAETDRLARLVGDLLALASIDATKLVVERQPVDVAGLARDTARRVEALAADRGVRVAVDAAAPAVASGDADRLVQLLLILLDNAFDHSPANGTVTVRVARAGRSVELSIADEGPGIPVADRARIFEPFARLPGVRRDRAGGTGLGLAIARRLVAAHDGTIAALDGPAGGAQFTVTLPAAASTPRGTKTRAADG